MGIVYKAADTTKRVRLGTHGARDVSFSHDSRSIVYETNLEGIKLQVLDLESNLPFPIQDTGLDQWNPVWAPDNRYIYIRDTRQLWRVPISTDEGFRAFEPEQVAIFNGAFNFDVHRDGRLLIHGPLPTTLKIQLLINAATLYEELAPHE